jgi:hypothetical protein
MNKFIIRIMLSFFLMIGSVWAAQPEDMSSLPQPSDKYYETKSVKQTD